MLILDTNMILRYLLKDNEEQSAAAAEIIRTKDVHTTAEVIAEAESEMYNVTSITAP